MSINLVALCTKVSRKRLCNIAMCSVTAVCSGNVAPLRRDLPQSPSEIHAVSGEVDLGIGRDSNPRPSYVVRVCVSVTVFVPY